MKTKLKMPAIATLVAVTTDKLQTAMMIHQPQVVQHLAFLPIESQNVNTNLLDTIGLIEEFKLEQDLIVKESSHQSYSSAVYENKTNKTIIVPAATHLKGGMQNRGNNQTEILGAGDSKEYNVNCFEPGRGSGSDHFTEFQDVPADVAKETMTHTESYNGSWNIIGDYTNLIKGIGRDALESFNERTKEDRAKFALNFETVTGQTGACIITKGISTVEVFPTHNTFNIYRQRLLRGKTASLFYKLHRTQPTQIILPSEVENKTNEMLEILQKAIEQTLDKGTKKHGLIVGRGRNEGRAIDVVLTDTDDPQVAYIFGAW